jgi:cytosine/adenosine deaminase-related metal-dependent hydrolase
MKKISANYIFPGNNTPIKNGVIVIDNNGVVLDVLNPETDNINWDEVEQHDGIICPGFINTHCHIELSYLKGKVSEHTQLHGFVKELMSIREDFSKEERLTAIKLAEQEMLQNGIVAVGDISNGPSSFEQKAKEKLAYHTFVEVFGLDIYDKEEENLVKDRLEWIIRHYHNSNRISMTAHAPYSLSPALVRMVNKTDAQLLSIHNQETASENELFQSGSGFLFEQLSEFSKFIKTWKPTGKNSLPSFLPNYNSNKKLLLVHNTYTSVEDIAFAKKYSDNLYWCFCPNANEYIEGKQPEYDLFINEKCTIGTDSLASNWGLSVLEELKTITKKNTTIPLETLIKWATINGAQFLGFDDKLGSIEKGKSPGINLIENVDLNKMVLNSECSVKKLV